jgi:hypothetical protein
MDLPEEVDEFRRKQITMTQQTWERLQYHGLTAASEIRLDFFYNAPTRAAALELEHLLRDETDYEVGVVSNRDVWGVRGRTQPTQVDEEVLLQWVDWMISAGLQHGVLFDGWGTQMPRR